MIQLTEKAVAKLKEIAESEGVPVSVRVKVIGGGCAGFSNDMSFEEKISDMDEVIESNDVKIIIDPLSIHYLEGTTIDYVDSDYTSGFKFLNPNVKGSCGCGSSVSY